MPFTPLHMGPGLALKAVAGPRLSLLSYGLAQVAMDLEPLLGMVRGADVLHGPTHTYLAALFIGAAVACLTVPICRPILRRWHRELSTYGLGWLSDAESWSARAVVTGALAGTLSHVLLDSLMHGDITPLAPWSLANDLAGLVSITVLELSCLAAGLFGGLLWLARGWRRRSAAAGLPPSS